MIRKLSLLRAGKKDMSLTRWSLLSHLWLNRCETQHFYITEELLGCTKPFFYSTAQTIAFFERGVIGSWRGDKVKVPGLALYIRRFYSLVQT